MVVGASKLECVNVSPRTMEHVVKKEVTVVVTRIYIHIINIERLAGLTVLRIVSCQYLFICIQDLNIMAFRLNIKAHRNFPTNV